MLSFAGLLLLVAEAQGCHNVCTRRRQFSRASSYRACAALPRYGLPSPYYRAGRLCACAARPRYCLPSPYYSACSLCARAAHLRGPSLLPSLRGQQPLRMRRPHRRSRGRALLRLGRLQSGARACSHTRRQQAGALRGRASSLRRQQPAHSLRLLPSCVSRSCPETRLDTIPPHTPLCPSLGRVAILAIRSVREEQVEPPEGQPRHLLPRRKWVDPQG